MATPFLQCRAGGGLRERAEKAAEDTGLELGTWLRTVVELACIAHEDVELAESESHPGEYYEVRRTQGTCTCLGFEHHGHCKHLEDPRAPEPGDISETYISDLERDAAELPREPAPPKVEHPAATLSDSAPSSEAAELSPRDCPHLWAWRVGGRCRCGTIVGRGVRMGR